MYSLLSIRRKLSCSINVTYRYFEHTGDGPFVVSSYINETPARELKMTYDDIPEYVSTDTGESTKMQSVVDFRPTRKFDGTFEGVFLPFSGQSFNVSYSFYLPRIDKLQSPVTRHLRLFRVFHPCNQYLQMRLQMQWKSIGLIFRHPHSNHLMSHPRQQKPKIYHE